MLSPLTSHNIFIPRCVREEYDSYKVRASSVLRQQKSKTPADVSTDLDKHDRERFENAIDQLKAKLSEVQEQMLAAKGEAELAQEDHDRLLQRHTKLVEDLEQREAAFRLRGEEMAKEKEETVAELQEKLESLEAQKSLQAQTYRQQVLKIKEECDSKVDLVQRQLDTSEMDNVRLQREIQQLQRSKGREDTEKISHAQYEFSPITSHPVGERQEGEGSELVEPEPVMMRSHQPTQSQQSSRFTFEQLIATPRDELPTAKNAPTPTISDETLKMNLVESNKKVEHLTELLSESEESVARLTEQAKILKSEIRRIERNDEREKEIQNMEYLKNIFLQFVCPKVGEQKAQLVPVLTTMLKLSPEEKARVMDVAQGEDQAQEAAQAAGGGGWGAYLHRWSGLT